MTKEEITIQQVILIEYANEEGRNAAIQRVLQDTNWITGTPNIHDPNAFKFTKTDKITLVQTENESQS